VTDPRAEYERRLAHWRERIAALDRINFRISNGRLALGVAGAILLWMAFVRATVSPAWPVAVWLAFAVLAVVHARRLQTYERALSAERLYLRGLDRLSGIWVGTGRDGAAFLGGHPYARDLDLFGPASLFELLNTTRTEIGEATLADWLSGPAPLAEVRARHLAVDELRPMLDFREDVAVLASESPIGRTALLTTWAASAPANFAPALRIVLAAVALTTIALAIAVYLERVGSEWLFTWILAELAVASIWRRPFHHVLHAIDTPEHDLALLAGLLARIESERVASPRLTGLQQSLMTHGVPPSKRIAKLRSLVSWLDSTHNLMFGPIAYVLLLRPQLAVAIDRWHRAYGPAVEAWLRAVGDVEALASLATFAYERPGAPFPELVDEGPLFHADALGHPLIPPASMVRNHVRLGGHDAPRVIIVSGSNMSGKSTLLRAVGVNAVLALAGAPVIADRLRLSALVLGATLRVEDSLQAGQSRFYAEILRIRTIVEAARGPAPMLFLLDEILHGTNSFDRRIGAEGIVRALVNLGAIGLVTTHDLALTELPSRLGPAATNMHFEDRLENGTMIFDYRMRPGVVEHSNALALMRAIGLDV
jgi:predicted ATPase